MVVLAHNIGNKIVLGLIAGRPRCRPRYRPVFSTDDQVHLLDGLVGATCTLAAHRHDDRVRLHTPCASYCGISGRQMGDGAKCCYIRRTRQCGSPPFQNFHHGLGIVNSPYSQSMEATVLLFICVKAPVVILTLIFSLRKKFSCANAHRHGLGAESGVQALRATRPPRSWQPLRERQNRPRGR